MTCVKYQSAVSEWKAPKGEEEPMVTQGTAAHTVWKHLDTCTRRFSGSTTAMTSDAVVAYFDLTNKTELVMDASPWGLSVILTQKTPGQEDRRVVAYTSSIQHFPGQLSVS